MIKKLHYKKITKKYYIKFNRGHHRRNVLSSEAVLAVLGIPIDKKIKKIIPLTK